MINLPRAEGVDDRFEALLRPGSRFDPVAAQTYVAGIAVPFLLQLGRQDESVTRESGEQLRDQMPAATKELIWYDGGHSLPVAIVPDAVAWFQTHLEGGGSD